MSTRLAVKRWARCALLVALLCACGDKEPPQDSGVPVDTHDSPPPEDSAASTNWLPRVSW